MSIRRISVALLATALASAAAGSAWAADKPAKPIDFTVRSEPVAAAPNTGKAMKWDASKGRFGFTLDVQQPAGRPATPNDVSAGAYFRRSEERSVGKDCGS